jgi:hypothetical protein
VSRAGIRSKHVAATSARSGKRGVTSRGGMFINFITCRSVQTASRWLLMRYSLYSPLDCWNGTTEFRYLPHSPYCIPVRVIIEVSNPLSGFRSSYYMRLTAKTKNVPMYKSSHFLEALYIGLWWGGGGGLTSVESVFGGNI